jgi:hypothetical protein
MELIGKLKKVNNIVERGEFKTRKVWFTTEWDSKYPQTVEVEVQQDKVNLFLTTPLDSEIKLYINLRGREWTKPETQVTSVFNSLVCWKMEVLKEGNNGPSKDGGVPLDVAPVEEPDISDLPF